jgi:single-stranded DNA-binding protein
MTEAAVSFAGNLTEDPPEVRYTDGGIARAMFRVAVSGRREQEPSFFTVIVWRDQAEHAAQSRLEGQRGWPPPGTPPASGRPADATRSSPG